jgi:hypothetical protein
VRRAISALSADAASSAAVAMPRGTLVLQSPMLVVSR